jgi:hypothetical protein
VEFWILIVMIRLNLFHHNSANYTHPN